MASSAARPKSISRVIMEGLGRLDDACTMPAGPWSRGIKTDRNDRVDHPLEACRAESLPPSIGFVAVTARSEGPWRMRLPVGG
jgi:hypothetical protein